jgi:hypothetical protein
MPKLLLQQQFGGPGTSAGLAVKGIHSNCIPTAFHNMVVDDFADIFCHYRFALLMWMTFHFITLLMHLQ